MSDPLLEPRPVVDAAMAATLLARWYELDGTLTPLHGERDRNFRVDTPSRRYVLKVHNPADDADVVEMRTRAIGHVRSTDPAFPVPAVVPTAAGEETVTVTGPDGRVSRVQLFSFLQGRHVTATELDEPLLYEWGRSTARLGRALRSFFHRAAGYPIQWDIQRAAKLRDRLSLVDGDARTLVTTVLDRFDASVAPRFAALRAQVVHGDMGPGNVLFGDDRHLSGVTDFGDTTHTALVCDLAVVVAEALQSRPDALDLAEPIIAGYTSITPLEDEEAWLLADLVAARAATEVVVTIWRHAAAEANADEQPDGAIAFLHRLAGFGFDEAGARFARMSRRALSPGALPYGRRARTELAAARARVLGPLELSYAEPLHLVRGDGSAVFDADGRRYLDAYNNVPVAGHCHPRVAEAIAAQASTLVTNTRYLHEAAIALAERLLALAPGDLDRVLFVNSGSEANDVALRIARSATGRQGALVTEFAYHGVTEATTALSPEGWAPGFSPEHIGLLPPPLGHDGDGASAVAAVERFAHGPSAPAAFFVDPAFTSDGILGPAGAWIRAVAASVRAAGGLVVGDEVQAGYGRTGSHVWSITSADVGPDLVTLGKPMGNGFPVAAVLGRSALVDPFIEATGYFSTFGGNTLACAAALATLDVVEREGLVEQAASVGAYLRRRVDHVARAHPGTGAVRSWGLLLGLELLDDLGAPDTARANAVVNALRGLGVLVGTTARAGNVLKVRPPLVFSIQDADVLVDRLDDALGVTDADHGRVR
jgi:4-aminobutyrate aminotransferase-like enzyme/Ser/Thr protein kinase RdoA (MazF antagonist)